MCMGFLSSVFLKFCFIFLICQFSKRIEKESMEWGEWGSREDLGGDGGREAVDRIYCMKNLFLRQTMKTTIF